MFYFIILLIGIITYSFMLAAGLIIWQKNHIKEKIGSTFYWLSALVSITSMVLAYEVLKKML